MYGLAHTGISSFVYGGVALFCVGSGLALRAWSRMTGAPVQTQNEDDDDE